MEVSAFWNLPVANRNRGLENQNSYGVLAQLVEHHNGIVGVRGSNPLGSTNLSIQFVPTWVSGALAIHAMTPP